MKLHLVLFALVAAPAFAQSGPVLFTPSAAFSVHDEPVDGLGDSFNTPPFEGLIRTQSTRADRACQEFDVASLAGAPIQSATLSGRVSVNNAFNNGVRTFDFLLYAGNGIEDLSDYQIPGAIVGSGQYQPPTTSFFDYSFDVTAAVQALVAGGATHIGLRCEGTSNPNFPNILSGTLSELTVDMGGTIGANYCGPAVPNSTGASSAISAVGSDIAAANDVTLVASNLPSFAFGFFITSEAQGMTPNAGGSQGTLCVSGSIGRYVGPGQIQQSDSSGAFSLPLDLTQTPTPTGFVAVMAGQTRHYQAWHRDAVGGTPTSNFTDAVSITFL